MITVQYKPFGFLGFEDDLWHVSSVTGNASLDTILEARSHFAQLFNFQRKSPQFIKEDAFEYLHTLRTEMSRESSDFRDDNFGFSRTVNLVQGFC